MKILLLQQCFCRRKVLFDLVVGVARTLPLSLGSLPLFINNAHDYPSGYVMAAPMTAEVSNVAQERDVETGSEAFRCSHGDAMSSPGAS